MKSTVLIFVIFAGIVNAEIPAGATDLVPRSDSPASESLKIKSMPTTTITVSSEQRDGYVFKPTGDYPENKEIEIRLNAPAFICASQLSNLTRKEVFVSARVQSIPISEIKIKAHPSIVTDEIIRKLKEANISIVEIGPYSLALVEIPINCPQPAIILK